MNWGNRIVVVFVLFVALIGTLVYKCMNQNFELVSKDYYKDELRYQEQINGMNNANQLSKVELSQTTDEVTIRLPKELDGRTINGEAWFYCAPNSMNDRKIPLRVNEIGLMKIKKSRLAKSYYQLKLNWQNGNSNYYTEQNIRIN